MAALESYGRLHDNCNGQGSREWSLERCRMAAQEPSGAARHEPWITPLTMAICMSFSGSTRIAMKDAPRTPWTSPQSTHSSGCTIIERKVVPPTRWITLPRRRTGNSRVPPRSSVGRVFTESSRKGGSVWQAEDRSGSTSTTLSCSTSPRFDRQPSGATTLLSSAGRTHLNDREAISRVNATIPCRLSEPIRTRQAGHQIEEVETPELCRCLFTRGAAPTVTIVCRVSVGGVRRIQWTYERLSSHHGFLNPKLSERSPASPPEPPWLLGHHSFASSPPSLMHLASIVIAQGIWGANAASILDGLIQRTYGTEYHMPYVRAIHARPQSDKPQLIEGRFVSKFGADLTEGYLAALDSVTTANFGGALMFLQADCINEKLRDIDDRCVRKNDAKYIVFYEIIMAQTNETIAQYADSWVLPEYGPMVPMDDGQCAPASDGAIPLECLQFNGDDGQPNLGPFVGEEVERKTAECRASTRKGLCDIGVAPDSVACTFSYDILGWVPLDDLVGITRLKDSSDNNYSNFSSWCRASIEHVEFSSEDGVTNVVSLPFWSDPTNKTRNIERTAKMIKLYQELVMGSFTSPQVAEADLSAFRELPSPLDLTQKNPPCYLTVPTCNSGYGCKRTGFSQICTPCTSPAAGCRNNPSFTFPHLARAVTKQPTAASDPPSKSTGNNNNEPATSDKASAAIKNESKSMVPLVAGIVCGVIVIVIFIVVVAKKKGSAENVNEAPAIKAPSPLADEAHFPRGNSSAIEPILFFAVADSPTYQTSSVHDTDAFINSSCLPSASASRASCINSIGVDVFEDAVVQASRVPYDSIYFGQLISRGAFGEVYLGTYNGEKIAIKRLLPEKRRDRAEVNAFLAEVKLMAILEHERIVRFIAVAWNALSDVCMVVEFMDNGDLRSVLNCWDRGDRKEQRKNGFDVAKIKIALHVAHALVYLHSLQPVVVHRDLKSRNVLLNAALDAKLTDFGVSRERANSTMTAGVGSLLWMAPEVMLGEWYDEKVDIFSFGVVLSELDTHKLPYSHAKEARTDLRIPDAAIPQLVILGRLSIAFSEDAEPVLQQLGRDCVSLDPRKRPTAAQVLRRVHDVYVQYL